MQLIILLLQLFFLTLLTSNYSNTTAIFSANPSFNQRAENKQSPAHASQITARMRETQQTINDIKRTTTSIKNKKVCNCSNCCNKIPDQTKQLNKQQQKIKQKTQHKQEQAHKELILEQNNYNKTNHKIAQELITEYEELHCIDNTEILIRTMT